MNLTKLTSYIVVTFLLSISGGAYAASEPTIVRVAIQPGLSFLPLLVMEQGKLLEKHARASGLGELKVTWSKFAGGNVMNDALLSGSVDFASGGLPPFLTLWGKTRDTPNEVKAACAMSAMPADLVTRVPGIRTISDFSDKDRIAVSAAKVSEQAIVLQMAAEKTFGTGNQYKLDPLTVTLAYPEAMIALLSGKGEIDSHFSAPPYSNWELEQPGMHSVVNSFDVLGGPSTWTVVWATSKFRLASPKTYAAFLSAFQEALDEVNHDKRAAAEAYLATSSDSRHSVDDILKILADPRITYGMTPQNTMGIAKFMYQAGSIKVEPASWTDFFAPEVHTLHGS